MFVPKYESRDTFRSFGASEFFGYYPVYKHRVRAPRKACCFLLGESPSRVRSNQPVFVEGTSVIVLTYTLHDRIAECFFDLDE